MTRTRHLVAILLIAVSLLGIAHVAVLPPFEGMDETAHYSSIAQIADTGTIPVLGRAYMAREVVDYQALGPMPYAPTPPYDANGGLTYRAFFAGRADAVAEGPSPAFAPSTQRNWQAQHPPLYYLLMAPLARMTAGAPLRERLLVLRSASLLLAVAGLCVAVAANRKLFPGAEIVTAAWPLLMPSWLPEMARLGNDSLGALLISLAWAGMIAILRGHRGTAWWVLVGISFGLGCLTKAYVIPIAAACLIALACHAWRHGSRTRFVLCLALVLALSLPWFLWTMANGAGSTNDSALLASRGGMGAGLLAHWSLPAMAYSLASMAKSFLWAGTWSLARPPALFYVPLALQWLLVLVGWRHLLRSRPDMAVLPLVPILPMLAGLAYHSLMWIAIDGSVGVTGGWYLHVLSAPLSLTLGLSMAMLIRRRWLRYAWVGLIGYAVAFSVAVTWLQVALFTGCAYRSGDTIPYQLDGGCLFDAPLMIERLAALAYPHLGLSAAGMGLGAVIMAAVLAWRRPPLDEVHGRHRASAFP